MNRRAYRQPISHAHARLIEPHYALTMSAPTLFDPVRAGDLALANRVVMAPLTRNRAPNAVPTPLMARCS